jgi:hypothetical protein
MVVDDDVDGRKGKSVVICIQREELCGDGE